MSLMTRNRIEPYGGYRLQLRSGRVIELQGLQQLRTYRTPLPGLPEREFNRRLIQAHLSMARRWGVAHCGFHLGPILIPPVAYTRRDETSGRLLKAANDRVCEFMPSVLTVALFDSGSMEAFNNYSSALFLWYQDRWGLPPTRIQNALGRTEWEAHAMNWSC